MGKLMISLSDEAEDLARKEAASLYYGRIGGLSIFFEKVVQEYFQRQNGGRHPMSKSDPRKGRSAPRPSNGTMTKPASDAAGRRRANTGRLATRSDIRKGIHNADVRASATPRNILDEVPRL